jgi:hypothetical protein
VDDWTVAVALPLLPLCTPLGGRGKRSSRSWSSITVTVSPPSRTFAPGQTIPFSCLERDPDGEVLTGRTVVWMSSNPTVAGVAPLSAGVIVVGGQEGTPQITCP